MDVCDSLLEYVYFYFNDKHLDLILDELKALKKGHDLKSDLEFEIGFDKLVKKISSEYKVSSPANKKTLKKLTGWLSVYVNFLFLVNMDRYISTHHKLIHSEITKEKLVNTISKQLLFGEELCEDHFVYEQFKRELRNKLMIII